MPRRLFLSLFLILCIGLGIGLASTFTGHDKVLRSQPAYALDMSATVSSATTGTSQNAQTRENLSPSVATEPPTAPLAVLDAISSTFAAHLKPGWLHVHAEKNFPPESSHGVLPNGQTIPSTQVEDTWYHLDEHGTVVEVVSTMRTASGELVQVGVMASNGTGWNSATGETNSWEPFRLELLDYGFSWDLQQASRSVDADIQVKEDVLLQQGSNGIEFVVSEVFNEPLVTSDGEKPVQSVVVRAVFDNDTGRLLMKDTTLHFQDGSTEAYPRVVLRYAYEHPPEDVLGYLEKVEMGGTEK